MLSFPSVLKEEQVTPGWTIEKHLLVPACCTHLPEVVLVLPVESIVIFRCLLRSPFLHLSIYPGNGFGRNFLYFLDTDTPTFARNKSFFPKGSTRLSGKCRNQSSLASKSSGNPSLSNIGTAHCGSLWAQTLLWLLPDLEVQLRFSDGSVAKKLFITTKVACIEALGVKPIDLQASAMVELSGLRKVAVFPCFSCFFPSSLFPPIPFPSMKLFDAYVSSLLHTKCSNQLDQSPLSPKSMPLSRVPRPNRSPPPWSNRQNSW